MSAIDKNKVQRKTKPIKYADKSAGQEHLILIFNQLKNILSQFIKDPVVVQADTPGQFSLYCKKQFQLAGKTYPEISFASILIQKGYVGFYFMPIYTHKAEVEKFLKPELLKLLKGKSCFHIKKMNEDLKTQIKEALQKGIVLYSKEK